MIDLIKKTMLLSLGLAFFTKDKVEELTNEIVEKGKLSGKESKDFFDDLLKKSEESRQEIEDQVTKIVKDSLKKMNIATHDDLLQLGKQIEELKKAINKKGESN
ncbi:MAG: hypothetical protein GY866_03695 [Proteobacteria bacterium]|nr:hypothetical protein [Pseudomonadota bacterium]